MGALQQKAMLVSCTVGTFGLSKKDGVATNLVENEYEMEKDSTSVSKKLFRPGVWKGVTNVISQARKYHLLATLPWSDQNNMRLLNSMDFFTYSERMRAFDSQLGQAVREVLGKWEHHMEDSKKYLGKRFDASLYPSPNQVEAKFYLKVSVFPIPDAGDFRVDLAQDEVDRIKAQIEAQHKDSFSAAVRSCWMRLAEVIEPFMARLETDDPSFRKGAIEKVVKVAQSLKSWKDVVNDAQLDSTIADIEKKLASYDEATLNINSFVREDAKDDTKKILDKMSGYLGGTP